MLGFLSREAGFMLLGQCAHPISFPAVLALGSTSISASPMPENLSHIRIEAGDRLPIRSGGGAIRRDVSILGFGRWRRRLLSAREFCENSAQFSQTRFVRMSATVSI